MKRFLCLTVFLASVATAQEAPPEKAPEAPPADKVQAGDWPFDGGGAVYLTWPTMLYDALVEYTLMISESKEGPWSAAATTKGTEGWKVKADLPAGGWGHEVDVHYLAPAWLYAAAWARSYFCLNYGPQRQSGADRVLPVLSIRICTSLHFGRRVS